MTLRIESDCSLSSTQRIVRFGFIVLFAVAQEKLGASDDWLFQSGMNRKAERHRLSSNADVNGTLAPLQKLFACACEHFFAVNTSPLSAENLPPAKLPQASTARELIILSSSPRTPAASMRIAAGHNGRDGTSPRAALDLRRESSRILPGHCEPATTRAGFLRR